MKTSRKRAKSGSFTRKNWVSSRISFVVGWICLGLILSTYALPAAVDRSKALSRRISRKGK